MRRHLLALAIPLITAHGCSHGPTAPERACRRWLQRYSTSGGRIFNCQPSFVTPSCSAFPVNVTITWGYRSFSDFVHEADVPNRVLAIRKETVGCSTFAYLGCARAVLLYEYDAQNRLVRRETSSGQTLGGAGATGVVTYSAWDRHGRPTEGQVESNGALSPLSIVYDDVRRIATTSNGEVVEQDVHGNVIREVQVGAGSPVENFYVIEALQDVCEENP